MSLSITGEGEGEGPVTTGWATDPTCAAQLASPGKHSTGLLLACKASLVDPKGSCNTDCAAPSCPRCGARLELYARRGWTTCDGGCDAQLAPGAACWSCNTCDEAFDSCQNCVSGVAHGDFLPSIVRGDVDGPVARRASAERRVDVADGGAYSYDEVRLPERRGTARSAGH